MKKIEKIKKPIIIVLLFVITISSVIYGHNKRIVNAQINKMVDFKGNYQDEMDTLLLDGFNDEYDTYMDWLDTCISENHVKEGIRMIGVLDHLKGRVLENNDNLYNSKYDEVSKKDISELEEEKRNDITSRLENIKEDKVTNNYKGAIEALDVLNEEVSNLLGELQKKKEEEANRQKEEQARLEEEKKKAESEAAQNEGGEKKSYRKSNGGNNSEDENNPQGGQGVQGSYVKNLKVASRTNQLVIVKGQGGSSATVEFHKKDGNGVWNQVFSTSGYVGQNGITYNKREGDRKTPAGVYGFGTGFGVAGDPGTNSSIGYRQINNDDYWVDDSSSSHYNTWCSTKNVAKDWNSAEHMISFPDAYRYGIVIQYNTDRVPGKGSGIFLHCKTRPTPGCVAIDSNLMVTLLQQINSSALIVIAPSESDLNNY